MAQYEILVYNSHAQYETYGEEVQNLKFIWYKAKLASEEQLALFRAHCLTDPNATTPTEQVPLKPFPNFPNTAVDTRDMSNFNFDHGYLVRLHALKQSLLPIEYQ